MSSCPRTSPGPGAAAGPGPALLPRLELVSLRKVKESAIVVWGRRRRGREMYDLFPALLTVLTANRKTDQTKAQSRQVAERASMAMPSYSAVQ